MPVHLLAECRALECKCNIDFSLQFERLKCRAGLLTLHRYRTERVSGELSADLRLSLQDWIDARNARWLEKRTSQAVGLTTLA